MEKEMGTDNMAGSIPKDPDPSHDFRESVNDNAAAQGAARGSKMTKQTANSSTSTYNG